MADCIECGNSYITTDELINLSTVCDGGKVAFLVVTGEPEPPVVNSLKLVFDTKDNADSLVGDSASVDDWNNFFDTSSYADTPFDNISLSGTAPCEITLYGGSNITVVDGYDDGLSSNINFGGCEGLLEIVDTGCIVEVGYCSFYDCINLTKCLLPSCIVVGDYGFGNCTDLETIDFSSLTTVGTGCFQFCSNLHSPNFSALTTISYQCFVLSGLNSCDFASVITVDGNAFQECHLISLGLPVCTSLGTTTGNDSVFDGIASQTITLTIPAALMTCNEGAPDGDIVYLGQNNTVTINGTPYTPPS